MTLDCFTFTTELELVALPLASPARGYLNGLRRPESHVLERRRGILFVFVFV